MAAKSGKLGAIYWGSTSMSSTETQLRQRVAMVRNWTLSHTAEPVEVTSFDSSGYRDYLCSTGGSTINLHGIHTWSGGAEKLWTSGGSTVNFDDWTGGSTATSSKFFIRLFVQWTSTPTAGKPAVYYYGPIRVMTAVNYNTPWDGAVSQDVTFQGCSKLQLAIIPSTWSDTAP